MTKVQSKLQKVIELNNRLMQQMSNESHTEQEYSQIWEQLQRGIAEEQRLEQIQLGLTKISLIKALQSQLQYLKKNHRIKTDYIFDVYCDRVNFIGDATAFKRFFTGYGIQGWIDRGGFSIDIEDALMTDIPCKIGSYRVVADARKKPIKF